MIRPGDVKLLILAGGFGTRLRATVVDRPKSLAPIEGVPFLRLLLQSYYRQGIRKFFLSLHFEAEQIVQFLKQESLPADLSIESYCEVRPLGTGGAVRFAYAQNSAPEGWLICNGDTYLSSGISAILAAAQYLAPSQSALAILPQIDPSRYGTVQFDPLSKRIINFSEKLKAPETPGLAHINAGLYFLSPSHLAQLPPGSARWSRIFPQITQRAELTAVPVDSEFIDIGTPADYAKFCSMLKTGVIKDSWT